MEFALLKCRMVKGQKEDAEEMYNWGTKDITLFWKVSFSISPITWKISSLASGASDVSDCYKYILKEV